MKHIFFAFPAGPAGVALFLVRLSVAISIAGTSRSMLERGPWLTSLLALAAMSLLVGVRIRAVSIVCAIGIVMASFMAATACWSSAVLFLQMVALALIGPGAYSVDAALFGRRTVRLPD